MYLCVISGCWKGEGLVALQNRRVVWPGLELDFLETMPHLYREKPQDR